MTVAELKKILSEISDDTEVVLELSNNGCVADITDTWKITNTLFLRGECEDDYDDDMEQLNEE